MSSNSSNRTTVIISTAGLSVLAVLSLVSLGTAPTDMTPVADGPPTVEVKDVTNHPVDPTTSESTTTTPVTPTTQQAVTVPPSTTTEAVRTVPSKAQIDGLAMRINQTVAAQFAENAFSQQWTIEMNGSQPLIDEVARKSARNPLTCTTKAPTSWTLGAPIVNGSAVSVALTINVGAKTQETTAIYADLESGKITGSTCF